jgi:hypothetical protein
MTRKTDDDAATKRRVFRGGPMNSSQSKAAAWNSARRAAHVRRLRRRSTANEKRNDNFEPISLERLKRHPAFRAGVMDFRARRLFKYDFGVTANDALQYEQGRHYAAGDYDTPDPLAEKSRPRRMKKLPKEDHPWR